MKIDGSTFKDDDVITGFKRHYEQIFSSPILRPEDSSISSFLENKCKEPEGSPNIILEKQVTIDEVTNCIKGLRKRKSPGIDGIVNEHIIHGGSTLCYALVELLNAIVDTENTPASWKTSIIIPLYKGNGKDKSAPTSYRPISLLTCFNKIFERIMLNRLESFTSLYCPVFPNPQQQGFQKSLSCVNAAFNLQETILHQWDQQTDVFVAFLDIKGAFDVVWHEGLFYKLANLGIVGKTLRTLMNSYQELKCVVKLQGMTSDPVPVNRSVRQGGVLSTFYYLVFIDKLLYDLQKSNFGAKISSLKVGNPTFADDISLVTITPADLQRLINIVHEYANLWKFEISIEKSCIVAFTRKRSLKHVPIYYGKSVLNEKTETTHLGMLQSSNGKVKEKILERCQKAKNAYYESSGMGVRSQGLNQVTAASIYKRIVMPVALYGSEL